LSDYSSEGEDADPNYNPFAPPVEGPNFKQLLRQDRNVKHKQEDRDNYSNGSQPDPVFDELEYVSEEFEDEYG
jgi:hypothetical protein